MENRRVGSSSSPWKWAADPFHILIFFLLLAVATGGSSWGHEGQLIVLRPIAIVVAAWGLVTMQPAHWRRYSVIWTIFAAAALLTTLHLVPLPYAWWSSLPGREIIAEIDSTVGFGQVSRPLSMQPESTVNALFSLAVPLAVLALGVQIDESGHRRFAAFLILMIAVSAIFGLLQLSGTQISLYEPDSGPSGLFNNRNHQGTFLAMVFPLAALAWGGGYHSGVPVQVERGISMALAFIILPLAVVSGSRSGIILICFGLIFALFEAVQRGRGSRTRGSNAIKLGWAGALLGLIGLIAWLTVFTGRDEAFTRFSDGADELRYPLWDSIIAAIQTYFPWGSGVGTYADVYQILEPDEMLRQTFSNHAHNEWLEIALTSGFPGLVILGAAGLAFGIGSIRAWRIRGDGGALPRVGLTLFAMLILASSVDYPVRTPVMSAILAVAALWMCQGSRLDTSKANSA